MVAVPARSLSNIGSARHIWNLAEGDLRANLPRSLYETWVQPLRPLGFADGVLSLGVANAYAADWLRARLLSSIQQALQAHTSGPIRVELVIVSSPSPAEPVEASVAETGEASVAETVEAAPVAEPVEAELVEAGPGVRVRPAPKDSPPPSNRKLMLQRAYGSERARIMQPERGLFLTLYLFERWLPILGHSAFTVILAARSMCYWNPMTGELRNQVEIEMSDLAARASVSLRTVKDVLANKLVKRYFLRYKVRRVITANGVRTAGIVLLVRMDDPLTPDDQQLSETLEDEQWYPADYMEEDDM